MTVKYSTSSTVYKQPIENSSKPTQTEWIKALKKFWGHSNARYAFLWLTGGILFASFMKPVIRKREKELMLEDIDQYLEKNRKKDSPQKKKKFD